MMNHALTFEQGSPFSAGHRDRDSILYHGTSQLPRTLYGLCNDREGWGPASLTRYDLTQCFEYSVLFGMHSLFAIAVFLSRIYYLRRHGKAHHLKRTTWIYWPTQICMMAAAGIAWMLSLHAYLSPNGPVIVAWGCLSLGIAWALAVGLNAYEHKYEIRSSSVIFTFYMSSITSALIIIHTTLDVGSSGYPTLVPLIVLTCVLTVGLIVEGWPRGGTRAQRLSSNTPYEKANLLSRLTFSYHLPIIKIGLRRPLRHEDLLGQLQMHMTAAVVYKKFSAAWSAGLRTKTSKDSPSLLAIILISQWKEVVPVLLSRIAIVLLSYMLPVLLKELLGYLEDHRSKPLSYGVTLAVGMFVSSLFASLLSTYNRYQMLMLGVTTRVGLISMIYRKALRLSARSKNESTNGEIANHMSVDADQWWEMYAYLSLWISIPLEVGIAMKLLYDILGWTMLAGVLTMLAMLPLQAWQARMYDGMQSKKLKAMDERIRLTTDILASMKIIKLYAWGKAFSERILAVRRRELHSLRQIGIVQAFMSIAFISSSLIISLVTFGVYALWGGPGFTPGKLTPQTVFVSMTLFAMLKGPIASLSDATTSTISALVSTRRIQTFLLREEVNENDILRFDHLPKDPQEPVISIKDATFSWTGPSDDTKHQRPVDERSGLLSEQESSVSIPPTLQNINLTIGRGEMAAIVGRVGQGKSSLLSALINDMYKLNGKVQISGRVAYVPQQAWIINKTLQENILFGSEYDEARYRQVIHASGLEPDIAILPGGDMTEIGERGINLSGGQKQRVSLARAAYADADIYLLDDPLSAVDAHVSKHLWDKLLGPKGMLRDKTRVLVTHGIHHLREVDQIVVLKDGAIEEIGEYSDLMSAKGVFYRLIKEYTVLEREQSKSANDLGQNDMVDGVSASTSGTATPDSLREGEEAGMTDGDDTNNRSNLSNDTENTVAPTEIKSEKNVKSKLTTIEALREGAVGWDVVIAYIRAVSYPISAVIVLLFVLAQGCLVSTNLWLKHWIAKSKEDPTGNSMSVSLFLGVYAALTLAYVLLYVVIEWLGLAVARVRAAERIHANLLARIFRLSMAFFDTTPLGRIINRFSSDMASIDIRVTQKIMDILLFGISVCSTLLMVAFTVRSFIFVVPFLVVAYWVVFKCFTCVSRMTMRIYAIARSPIYHHFSESLGGVATIRAFRVQDRFIEANAVLTDRATNICVSNMTCRRWLESNLRILSSVVLLCTALFAVLDSEDVDPSLVGLTLSFALTLTEEMTTVVRSCSDFQNQLVWLERVLEYSELKTEAPETTDVILPLNWPSQGHIRFVNYSARYREGLDLAIRNIDLDIAPAEKVGIVGRTGAGKSSLTLVLFRIIEAANSYWAKESDNNQDITSHDARVSDARAEEDEGEEIDGGRIEIDGVDISTIGLQDLRKNLAIIPQDPTLFAGSVRENLDPFNEFDDAKLWEALERSHLKEYINALPGGLSFEVAQNGENFSVGQRSLICLARALLRNTKILVLDEATAAVDVETDELIQKTIRKEFKDRTILTIAHRIKTVMDNDKILVLDRGQVAEFDTPSRLLAKGEDSVFYKLAVQAGEVQP